MKIFLKNRWLFSIEADIRFKPSLKIKRFNNFRAHVKSMSCSGSLKSAILNEAVPSAGCTEVASIAYATALSKEHSSAPFNVEIYLDHGTFKNAVAAGVPGRKSGIMDAVAKALAAKPRSLETLLEQAEVDRNLFTLSIFPLKLDDIFIYSKVNDSSSIIAGKHDAVLYTGKAFESFNDALKMADRSKKYSLKELLSKSGYVVPYADALSCYDELAADPEIRSLVKRAVELDIKLSEDGLRQIYRGYSAYLKDGTAVEKAVKLSSAAVEARMSGSFFPAMAIAGSGNQGITATLPIYVYAKEKGYKEEDMIKAIIISWLTTIYATLYLGYISPLCSVGTKGGAGLAAGLAALMSEFDLKIAEMAAVNQVEALGGVLCDGAKPSCSLKTSTGVQTAFTSAELALKGVTVDHREGISGKSFEDVIKNVEEIKEESEDDMNSSLVKIFAKKFPYVHLNYYF